ncbi:MAG TPA: S41 family peptidase [Candidatus Paceibacterota bacterium]|nr:S41 family peptidase [Candidatus Paceibacterota bacterium]
MDERDMRHTSSRGISAPAAAIGGILLALAMFAGGWALGTNRGVVAAHLPAAVGNALGAADESEPADVDFGPAWKVWHILDEKFVPAALGTTTTSTTTPQQREWGMIEGMVASLGDPYTVFMPPTDAASFQEDISGSFEGVGMEIDIVDGVLTVVSPLKDTPAAKAGIEAQDKILAIDATSTENMDVDTAVKLIRGPAGTTVTLSVLHQGATKPVDISITRGTIDIPTIDTKALPGGIFVISLASFTSQSADLFRGALRDFVNSGDHKLILDLRGNPGGYLDAAVDMASWFVPAGQVIVTEDYGGKQDPIVHRSLGYDLFKNQNLQMVILVDSGTASAAEILSGALHDYGVATLIGTHTFGKGSVQELIPITADTDLKVTVARWLMPKGEWIQRTGIEPDIYATTTIEDVRAGKDPQMDRAVQYLETGK